MQSGHDHQEPSIWAVVVTYHPDLAVLEEMLESLCDQVAATIVVDNSEDRNVAAWLDHRGRNDRLELLAQGRNAGLGAAQNRGIARARESGASHVLLLDQDSVPSGGMVRRLFSALSALESRGERIAAVGPRYVDSRSRRPSYFVAAGGFGRRRLRCSQASSGDVVKTEFLISSGALIPMPTLDAVGAMDESLFVDHVDSEWFLRAAARGYRAFGVCDAEMTHHLGTGRRRVWFGVWHELACYEPSRYYYIFRNSVLLFRRRYVPLRWMAAEVFRLGALFFLHALAREERWRRMSMMLRGLRDGWRGRLGSIDAN